MTPRRLVRIASGCKTEEQFVAIFHRFCDGESIFIPTRTPKPVGETLGFVVTLASGEALFAGTGSVSESHEDKSGPFGRSGMRIAFSKLEDGAAPILTRLSAARAKAAETSAKDAEAGPKGKAGRAKGKAAATEAKAPAPEKSTVLGIPPIAPPQPSSVRIDSPEPDKPPDSGTQKTFALPPPVVHPPAHRILSSPVVVEADAEAPKTAAEDPDRANGSGVVLPANPFEDLDNVSLEHFVECTLYEERATTADPGDDADLGVPANAGDDNDAIARGAVDEPARPARTATASRSTAPAAVQIGDRVVPLRWVLVGGGAAILMAGLALGLLFRGNGSARAGAEPAPPAASMAIDTAAASVPPAATRASDASLAPGEGPDPVIEPDAGPASPPAACSIDVRTRPEGSSVRVGEAVLGETPGVFEVPCGEVAVTVDHPRYAERTKTVTAVLGEPARLDGRLARPRFRLRIRTQPPGAKISVDGEPVGVSPVTITVKGFQRSRVMASKRGYYLEARRVALRKNGSVTLKLRPARKRRR